MPAEKTQSFCPCSRVLNRSGKGLIPEINTNFVDQLLTYLVFRKAYPTLGSEFLITYHNVLQALRMKRNFKVAVKNFYTHTPFILWMNFLYVQIICITDLYDCVNPYTVLFLYVCMFMTCSISYCLVTASGIHGMYVYIPIIMVILSVQRVKELYMLQFHQINTYINVITCFVISCMFHILSWPSSGRTYDQHAEITEYI